MFSFRAPSGFSFWLSENQPGLAEESPELSEADLVKLAMQKWRSLTPEEKKVGTYIWFSVTPCVYLLARWIMFFWKLVLLYIVLLRSRFSEFRRLSPENYCPAFKENIGYKYLGIYFKTLGNFQFTKWTTVKYWIAGLVFHKTSGLKPSFYEAFESTQICAPSVFFLSLFFLQLWYTNEPKLSIFFLFLCIQYTNWEYWSLTMAKLVQCLNESYLYQYYMAVFVSFLGMGSQG